ncbi:MAG: hypothetical protein KBA66_21680 [Leptospiraceae bacterium]|nr:hypothetical protein [Leptospiraceae bacterium]
MNEYHQRIYKATDEHEQEFNQLCKLRSKNKIYFLSYDMGISDYEGLLSMVYHLLYKKQIFKEVYSDKTLAFFRIMNQQILFFEKNSKVMKSIFNKAFQYYKKNRTGLHNYSHNFINYFDMLREVKLSDLTHFTIDLSDIFKIESNWEEFPENLTKHPFQIRKSIYKSLLESMIDRIEYYYSESNYFFGKWEKRNIRFVVSENGIFPIYSVSTTQSIFNILCRVSGGNNWDVSAEVTALDNVLERIYQKEKKTLLKMSPLNLRFVLEDLGEGDSIEDMEKFITGSLFCKRDPYF